MCDCINQMDALLAEKNTGVVFTMFGKPPRMLVATYQRERGRGKPKETALIAAYCPCCGEKYVADAPAAQAEAA